MSEKRFAFNPLDAMEVSPTANEETPKPTVKKTASKRQEPQPEKVVEAKERMTVQISSATIDRVKNAVYWTPGLTVAQLTEEALEHALERIEKKNGKPFDKRHKELKPGRPVK